MDDLISRQAAINAIRKIYDSVGILGEKWAVDKCQMAIKDLPSAQPEIIFCKDCKHWEQESICEGYCHATEFGGIDEDHFCSYAERRK